MRITEDEYKAVQDAPDPQPLSGGAWPAAQSSYGPSYQSDGLGHYSTDGGATWMNDSGGQYQEPPSTGLGNYNLGFGGSPVTSYATPDANSDGLNDTTGWAMGVEQDQNSPTGFSYNGAPVSSNGAPYTPPTYQQPGGDWYNYDNQAPQNYNLVGPGLDQIATTPTPQADYFNRFGGASGGTSALDKLGTLGSDALTALQAPQQYVGGPIAQAAWEHPGAALSFAANPIGGIQSLALGAATNPQGAADTYQSAYQANQDVLNDPNLNPFLRELYRTGTDPLSYVGPSVAAKLIPGEGAVPSLLRGAIDQGGLGAVLGGNLGAVAGTTKAAEDIPLFGDQPAWLRGLETGVLGGVGGMGAAHTFSGIGNAAREAGGFGPLLKSEVGSTPPLGKGGEPPKVTGNPGLDEMRQKLYNDLGAYQTQAGETIKQVDPNTMEMFSVAKNRFGNLEEIPGTRKPLDYVYRAVSDEELATIQKTGVIRSDGRMNLIPGEGTVAAVEPAPFYLPRDAQGNPQGAIIKIKVDPTDGWHTDPADSYIKTSNTIPANRIEGISKFGSAAAVVTTPTDTSLNPVRRQIADALDNELKFRNSGEAEAIKAAKRAEQASGINLAQAGNTSAETLANVSSGAKVGQFFDKTPGLKLPEEQYNAALKDVLDSTEGFDKLQAVKALDKLQNGQRLQPGEIKTLGKLYGPEIEAKIRATNADRIQTVAELTPEDITRINRQAEVDGKRVATLEVQSQRQHELADNLQKQLNMDPTNKALKKAAEDARARGLAQQNTADRLLADRAEKLTANLPSRTETQILRTEQAATGTAKAAEQADKVALRNESKAFFKASPEQAVTNAKNVVAKLDVPDSLKSQLIDTIEIGARKQSLILDGMGDSGPGILRKIYASATGEVTDSYTSKLLTQRAFMENALQSGGLSKEASKAIGKLLQDAELRQRFGNAIPDYVTKSLDEAKFNFSEGGAIKGLADISQELKNTQFGIGDVAVFGQQAAKAGLTNAPQIVTGYVNRALQALHLGGVNTAIPEASIARDTQYALDGLALHSHAITDIVSNERTLLSRLGAPGRIIDQSVALPIIKKLTDFQFDTVLGNLRKTIYEGNLVMAHLSGADISNPAVRLRSAEMANAATGAGKLAQRSARANAEKAFLLSPSMRRAQIQQMTQVIKGLSHQDTALTSALAITSSVGLTLGVGKLLSDYLNLPFETDPSKPGFGNIRLPDGTTVNPFSQEQIAKAFARSLRILAEDPSTDGAKRISEEWGKILVSSASPGLRPILASMGVGIDQNGYHWGDLGQGQSLGQRVLNAAPIPPLAQSIIQNGVSPVRTPLETLGFNAYPESKYAKRAQELGPNPTEKQLFDYEQKNGRIYSSDPTIKAQQVEADRAHQEQLDRQNARDTELTTGTWSPAKATQWREQRKQDNLYFAGRFDQLYSGVNFKDSNVTDVDRYYKAIADNTDRVTGDINWDAVDAATKGLNQEYIKANTNLRDTSIEKSYRTALDTIESSGYFNRQEQTWAKVQKYSDEAKAYPDYYAWKDAKLEEQTQKFMDRYGYDKLYAAAMAEKAVNASAPEKIYDGYSKQWKADWVMQNPAAAYQAWTWGYYTPTDDMKAYLNKWAKGQ